MTSDNRHPFYQANLWSRMFHSWILKLLNKSHREQTLHLNDLYELMPEFESTRLIDQLESNWFEELKRSNRQPSIIRAMIKTLGWRPLLVGLLLIPSELSKFAQPILLTFLMGYFESCSTMQTWQAWLFVFGAAFSCLLTSTIYNQYFYRICLIGLQMRTAYTGLIFRKILRLSSHSMNNLSSGQITNLIANDAGQVDFMFYFINFIWMAPLELAFAVYFFWKYVKYIAFIAVGYTLLLLAIQSFSGRLIVYVRTRSLLVTDERVKIMSEIIKSMRIVKMYCWEMAFNRKIREIRKREILQYALRLSIDGAQTTFSHTFLGITFLLMYGTMWLLGMSFDTRFFALAACMLAYMRLSIVDFFSFAIRFLVQYLAARKRIESFLLLDESERDNRLLSTSTLHLAPNGHLTEEKSIEKQIAVKCNLKEARWEQTGTFSLKNIIFEANPGDLICVIGPVGSGKSSLLQTLTGEIAWFDGKVRLNGSFCYVPQEPWIFSSTIKNNIIFGQEYNHRLFKRVISATALDTDFLQLSHGANTMVGDQGVMLSGGQKARVNMARALYRDADIYLLDDPLSAVDVKVSKHLFDRSIKTYLREKICILVTHQIQFLQDATRIIVLNNGEMVEMGTYEELLSSSAAFARLLEDINQHEQEQQAEEQKATLVKRMSRVDSVQSDAEKEEDMKSAATNTEMKQEGTVKWNVYLSYIRAGIGAISGLLIIFVTFSLQQTISLYGNYWLAQWSNDESHRHQIYKNCTSKLDEKTARIQAMTNTEWNLFRNHRFYTYCYICGILVIITLVRAVLIGSMCLNASRILHNKMFRRLIRSPIEFFDLNPVGRILNRFTKDVSNMDEQLPLNFFDFLQCLFQVLGAIVLVGALNPWAFIPAIITAGSMLFVRYRFARCLRDLKRIEGITRSPIYSQLSSTIYGLKVIRSYHAEDISCKEFFHSLDDNTRANFLILVTNRWAAIRFDWIACAFILVVTILAMVVRIVHQQFTAADIALTLAYSLNLMGLVQWTIRQSVEVESQMTSVERVLEYCQLDQEPPAQVPSKQQPPSHWPSHGQITYDNVCMSHSKDLHAPLALKHISLSIRSAEKVGIVGRTGAGKSSFIQTLFRMGTLTDGYIKIDGIDIATVGLDDVRRRISIIPQDPVLFTGTMRSNLDQFGDYSDAEIWHALEQVQLKKLVSSVLPNGLQSLVSESGSNLSVGQKQLVCLARAILKKSKILVIDEATANVDNETDELIQRSIREQFRECTVLTVAHRLRTVIDSDRILVLGNGELLEFDSPHILLSDPESQFSSLVEQTGVSEAQYLRSLANTAALKIKTETGSFYDNYNENLEAQGEENDPLVV